MKQALVAGALATFALSQGASAQSGAGLAALVPAEPGRTLCFVRTYSSDHMKSRPRQTVSSIALALKYRRYDPPTTGGYRPFAVGISQRGRRARVSAGGTCEAHQSGAAGTLATCSVDCDGGGVELVREGADKLRVRLAFGRLVLGGDCDGGGKRVTLGQGSDDREFVLSPAPVSACAFLKGDLPE